MGLRLRKSSDRSVCVCVVGFAGTERSDRSFSDGREVVILLRDIPVVCVCVSSQGVVRASAGPAGGQSAKRRRFPGVCAERTREQFFFGHKPASGGTLHHCPQRGIQVTAIQGTGYTT